MKALGKIINKVATAPKSKGQHGTDYRNYAPYESGHKSFRTGQDTVGSGKKTLLQRLVYRRRSKSRTIYGNDFQSTHTEKKKRQFILPGIATVALLLLLGYLTKGLFLDISSEITYFQVQKMVVKGCRVTTEEEIRQLGGFTFGSSLFSIQPKEIENLLKKHVWIQGAKLERVWPNGLYVTVWEHEPEAMVTQGDSGQEKLYYVNKKGVCFSPVLAGEDIDFPVITGLHSLIDERERKEALREALQFLKLAGNNNPNLPAQLVSEINIDEKEGMVIYLVDHPFPIYFGRENVSKKFKQLRQVLEILYKKQKNQTKITQVKYIRLDYLTNKVLVAQSGSG